MKHAAALITILLLILVQLSASAGAQPLPPPIYVPNVTPPLTIPSEMVLELQNGRIVCERKRAKFDINLTHLTRADINGDGIEDFIMSTAGYLCNGSNIDFTDINGQDYFIFTSLPGGKYAQHSRVMHAYGVSIDHEFSPPHLVFRAQCPRRLDTENFGFSRLQWNGREMRAVTLDSGCDGRPVDSKALIIVKHPPKPDTPPGAVTPPPVAPKPAEPKPPQRVFDITDFDAPGLAPGYAPLDPVSNAMTPEPVAPPPPAPASAPAPVPMANPEISAALSPPDPIAAPDYIISPRPEHAPRRENPTILRPEDILNAPAHPFPAPRTVPRTVNE